MIKPRNQFSPAEEINMFENHQIAMVCHEANRALQLIQDAPGIPVADPWELIDDDMVESVVIGVAGVLAGNTPVQSHALWCETRREQGWVYGPVKDAAKKTHPCLVPYDQLPEDQQLKDALFATIVYCLDTREVARFVRVHSQEPTEDNRWVMPLLHWLNGETEELSFDGLKIPDRLRALLIRGLH
jgi:RyR domain